MIEMTVGSRFWYDRKLCEVAETEIDFRCEKCVFDADRYTCENTECRAAKRHDGKSVCYKEVTEAEEQNNG